MAVASHMCSLLHQRYAEFMGLFRKDFPKVFNCIDCKEDEKVSIFYVIHKTDDIPAEKHMFKTNI